MQPVLSIYNLKNKKFWSSTLADAFTTIKEALDTFYI